MRLDKYLASASGSSRSQCKKNIRNGAVAINGIKVTDPAYNVKEKDVVTLFGKELVYREHLFYMFHKPGDCICARRDEKEKTVLDYFAPDVRKRLLIAGRLDKDTEGILLLTDDGAFVHRIMHPSRHVKKTYFFEGDGTLCKDATALVKEGLDIGDETKTAPGELTVQQITPDRFSGTLTISEGRYHQVKRMVHALGGSVTYLKRIRIGGLKLDPGLPPGAYRELSEEEIEAIQKG